MQSQGGVWNLALNVGVHNIVMLTTRWCLKPCVDYLSCTTLYCFASCSGTKCLVFDQIQQLHGCVAGVEALSIEWMSGWISSQIWRMRTQWMSVLVLRWCCTFFGSCGCLSVVSQSYNVMSIVFIARLQVKWTVKTNRANVLFSVEFVDSDGDRYNTACILLLLTWCFDW